MESQEEYNKEVQELYDQIQQQMDQEINEAKKQQQERQTPKIVEEEDKDALSNQTQLTLDDDETAIIAFITGQTDNELWINAKANVSTALASEQNLKKEERTLDEMLPPELMDYRHVFDKMTAEQFPESRSWGHAINLKDDFIPKDCKVYPLTVPEQAELDKFLKENLEKGYIWPFKSPMASPFFFVDKKDGKLRPCQDYQALNKGTIKNAYLLSLISELIDKLKGAKYFTKLDVRWGYNNVHIKDRDQWKVAFKTNKGLFEPTVMFFGLCNSPATFQSMMDNLFIFENSKGWVIIYMDDIFIFTKEMDDNIEKTRRILQRLTDNNLYLKPEKCVFWQTKVEYLGLIIEENKLAMDPVKLSGIANWPTPNTLKQVHSFFHKGVRTETDIDLTGIKEHHSFGAVSIELRQKGRF